MTKRAIFSDIHFGDPDCSFDHPEVVAGVCQFLHDQGPIDELILAGDILDANISSFGDAFFGDRGAGPRLGLKGWLHAILGEGGVAVDRILYIPGNHDYKVWDLLATHENFIKVLERGEEPEPGSLPIMEEAFTGSFVAGIAPEPYRDNLVVKYPDHAFLVGDRTALITHGHYIDTVQTSFLTIEEAIEKRGGDLEAGRRFFFQRTAQYQAVANAVSYVKATREEIDWLHKELSHLYNISLGRLRHVVIDAAQLESIEQYLRDFRGLDPDIFIFGHTHEAAHTTTAGKDRTEEKRLIPKIIDVWNIGCFLQATDLAGSFMIIDDTQPAETQLTLYDTAMSGRVMKRET